MKKTLLIIAFLIISSLKTPANAEQRISALHEHSDYIRLNEISMTTGYAWSDLKGINPEDFEMYLVSLQFGFDINPLFHLQQHRGTIQFILEPMLHPIVNPEYGVAAGIGVNFKYSYPVFKKLSAYATIGSAPIYFGVDTFEQGNADFNFLNQAEIGIQYFYARNKSLNLGYRLFHISDFDIGDSPNSGIDGSAVSVGLSLYY